MMGKINGSCRFVEGFANSPGDLTNVITELAAFLMPHAIAAAEK
jgi:hypothetical protein